MTTKITLLLLALFSAILIPRNAHAYLDPGTGSYVVQMVIAGLLGAAFAIKMFWVRIKAFVGRVFSRGTRNE